MEEMCFSGHGGDEFYSQRSYILNYNSTANKFRVLTNKLRFWKFTNMSWFYSRYFFPDVKQLYFEITSIFIRLQCKFDISSYLMKLKFQADGFIRERMTKSNEFIISQLPNIVLMLPITFHSLSPNIHLLYF